jgi:hypothetical protein
MAHLARVGEVSDHSGKASTVLATTIGYPGSSVAFAQLLTGMERAGLIQREIRGKRTYRIIPGPAAWAADAGPAAGESAVAPAPAGEAVAETTSAGAVAARTRSARSAPGAGHSGSAAGLTAAGQVSPGRGSRARSAGTPAAGPAAAGPAPAGLDAADAVRAGAGLDLLAGAGLDYDELARRLLVQVARRLAGPDGSRGTGEPDAAGSSGSGSGEVALQETVASLEQKLASATSRQRSLAEENARLREQLRTAEQSLAQAQERASADGLAGRFDSAEVLLLERLLSPLREERRRHTEADAG